MAVAALLFIATLFVLGDGRWLSKKEEFIIYFPESVNGLSVGAPVKFRGVQIGEVRRILIHYNQPADNLSIPVIISIDYTRLDKRLLGMPADLKDEEEFVNAIRSGLRAKLEFQSIVTGVLYIELDYYPSAAPYTLVQVEPLFREIPSLESTSSDIVKSVTQTIKNISEINFKEMAGRLDRVLSQAEMGLSQMEFKAINDRLLSALTRADEGLSAMEFKTINDKLIATLDGAHGLVNDPNVKTSIAKFHETLETANQALGAVRDTLRPDSSLRYELDNTLFELGAAARAFRQLAEYLDRNPSALLTGRPGPEK